jgi:putative phosphoribosyl transferase
MVPFEQYEATARRTVTFHTICIESTGATLGGELTMPDDPVGLIVLGQACAGQRFCSCSRRVREAFLHHRLATLDVDLLTATEQCRDIATAALSFDIVLLADRLVGVIDWTQRWLSTASLATGLVGASTAAAAALVAAANRCEIVRGVVCRGGRLDLAERDLPRVAAATRLIVGERDTLFIELNRRAFGRLRGPKDLTTIPHATHLFEEPGALDQVAQLSVDWFVQHLN